MRRKIAILAETVVSLINALIIINLTNASRNLTTMELERFQCPDCDTISQYESSCVSCDTILGKVSRCAWCVQWSATDDYCEHCGSLIVPLNQFFAARVLKRQGISQISINIDLEKLDSSQLSSYERQFDRQKALIKKVLDAVQQCQELLFFKSYTDEFARRLIKALPLSEEELVKYGKVFKDLPSSSSERLLGLAAKSDCPDLMQLALMALVRSTDLVMDSEQARKWYEQVTEFASGDSEYVFEALMSLGHWRTQLAPFFIEQYSNDAGKKIYTASYTKLHTADGIVAQWMAVVCARTEYFNQGKAPAKTKKLVKKLLNKSLESTDTDLRIASAMILGDAPVLASFINDDNQSLRQVSISILAREGSEEIIPIIESGDPTAFATTIDTLLHRDDKNFSQAIALSLLNSLEVYPDYVEQILELIVEQPNFQETLIPEKLKQLLGSGEIDSQKIDLVMSLARHCETDIAQLLSPMLEKMSQDVSYLSQLAKMARDLEFGPKIANNINRVTRKLLGTEEFKLHSAQLATIYKQQLAPAYASGFMYLQFLSEHLFHQSPAVSDDIFALLGQDVSELLMLNRFAEDNTKFCFSPDLCEACFGSLDNFVHAVSYILQQPGQYQCEPWLIEVLMNSQHEFRDAVAENPVAAQYFTGSLVAHADSDKSLLESVTRYISAPAGTQQSPLLNALTFDSVSDALLEILTAASSGYVFPRRLLIELLQYYELDQRPEFTRQVKTILVNQCQRTPQYAYITYAYLVKASMDMDKPEMANSAAEIFHHICDKGVPYQSVKDGVAYAINDLKGVAASFFDSGLDFIEQASVIFSSPNEMCIEAWLYDLLVKDSECALDMFSENPKLMAMLLASLSQAMIREKYSAKLAKKSLECISLYIEKTECNKQIKNDTMNAIKVARETGKVSRYTLSQVSQFYTEMRKHCLNTPKHLDERVKTTLYKHKTSSLDVAMPNEPITYGFEVSDNWLRKFSKALTESSISRLMPVLGHFHNHSYEFRPLLEDNGQLRARILDGLIELLFAESTLKEEYLSQRLLAAEIISSIALLSEDAAYCISRLRNKLLSSNVESIHEEYVSRLISTLSELRNDKHGQQGISEAEDQLELQRKRTGHVGNMISKLGLSSKISASEYTNVSDDPQIIAQIEHACELAAEGDFITSVKVLKIVLKEIDSDSIFYLIALVFVMHDLPDQATRYLQQCLVRNPSHSTALELYVRIQELVYHDYLFAIELAKRILVLKPDSVSTLTRLASISIRLGDYAGATRYIQQAMKVDPKSPDIYFQLGEILFHTQRFREAINNYKKAASCGKRDGENYTAIARTSLLVNDRDSAMRNFEMAIDSDDTFDEAFYGLGRLYRKNKEYKSADYCLTRAVELNDRNEDYTWELTLNCIARGEKDRAFALLESMANGTNPSAKIYRELASLCMEKASWYEAQDNYEKAVAAEPDSFELYFSLAKSYAKTKSWGNAVGILQRAIDIKPDFIEALRMSAKIYYDMERYPQAQDFYQRVLALDPECQDSRIHLGAICNLKNDFKSAAGYLIEVLKKDNNSAIAHCCYATTLAALNEYKKSTKHFDKAIELNPEYADAYVRLGNAYYHIQDFDAAAKNYKRGAEIDPDAEGLDEYLKDLVGHLQDSSTKVEIESLLNTRQVRH